MKSEIINLPGKGICILISDINFTDFGINNPSITNISENSPFTDIHAIADLIYKGKKIHLIKEIRRQTGWGLKEAKIYSDKYLSNRMGIEDWRYKGRKFISDHTSQPFLEEDELKI